jgi:hypothetical protein
MAADMSGFIMPRPFTRIPAISKTRHGINGITAGFVVDLSGRCVFLRSAHYPPKEINLFKEAINRKIISQHFRILTLNTYLE